MTTRVDLPELLPNGPCDICGSLLGVGWWLGTAARVCCDPACHSAHAELFAKHAATLSDDLHVWTN